MERMMKIVFNLAVLSMFLVLVANGGGSQLEWDSSRVALRLSGGSVEYVGCYKDDSYRDLKHGPKEYGYTARSCANACNSYAYVALQNNGECYCDDSYSTPETAYPKTPDEDCNIHGFQKGGPWRNAVCSEPPSHHTFLIPHINSFHLVALHHSLLLH